MPMLLSWTDELVRTTLYPAHQLCTDDFTGPLANNTNLGQKGIVAIRAYARRTSRALHRERTPCERTHARAHARARALAHAPSPRVGVHHPTAPARAHHPIADVGLHPHPGMRSSQS